MKNIDTVMHIDGKGVGEGHPVYFIADIAANHDGDINQAKELIYRAKEAGADAAKFQHFRAEHIVSDIGFKMLGDKKSHQAQWSKSVFQVYQDASVRREWTEVLKDTCQDAEISFFTSPYDLDTVDYIDSFVPAFKVGSGDITWVQIIKHIAAKQKPYIIATGAASIDDVLRAVLAGISVNPQLALLQCNTNYTGSLDNLRFVQLNVLKTYREMFPSMILGLSDHTPGHATVLGAVALGAKIIEKHFTLDTTRVGPDHRFSMDQRSWNDMVVRTRELEAALGAGVKKIEENELETSILQRRSIRVNQRLNKGHKITENDLIVLRPCPDDGIPPYKIGEIIGKTLIRDIEAGRHLRVGDFE
jgi:sialic acid synthase SpsE